MNKSVRRIVIFSIISLIVMLSCYILSNRKTNRYNIILIVFDTFRRDFISYCNHNSIIETPHIDCFLQNSIEYINAYTRNTYTLPSHTTMLSGLTPRKHGIRKNGQILDHSLTTVPELLNIGGYKTAALYEIAALSEPSGFSSGFDVFENCQIQNGPTIAHISNWLQTTGDKPYFLFINLSTVHVSRTLPQNISPLTVGFLDGPYYDMRANRELETVNLLLPPGKSILTFKAKRPSFPGIVNPQPLEIALWDFRIRPVSHLTYSWSPSVQHAERVEYLVFPPEWTENDIIFRNATELILTNNSSDTTLATIQFRSYPNYSKDLEGDRMQYALSVQTTDSLLGELVKTIKQHTNPNKTAIILTSDHGEGLEDHRDRLHGHEVYEESARVPLGILIPRRKPEKRIGLVPLDAIAPTILDMARIAIPPEMYPHSLADKRMHGEDFLVSETFLEPYASQLEPLSDDYSVRSDIYSLVHDHRVRHSLIFDRVRDPMEKADVSDSLDGIRHMYETEYADYSRNQQQGAYQSLESDDPQLIEALRKLGYVE